MSLADKIHVSPELVACMAPVQASVKRRMKASGEKEKKKLEQETTATSLPPPRP